MMLTQITGAAADIVTLGEAKTWAKIDTTEDDPLIASLISSATVAAEEFTRRAFINQTWKLTIDLCPSGLDLGEGVYDLPPSALYGDLKPMIELPKVPVSSITSVTTYDTANTGTVFSSSNYSLIGNRLILNYDASWPTGLRSYGACEIVYVAGYGATSTSVPNPIKTAVLMHVQAMYDGRIVCDMPPSSEHLLRQYRVYA